MIISDILTIVSDNTCLKPKLQRDKAFNFMEFFLCEMYLEFGVVGSREW